MPIRLKDLLWPLVALAVMLVLRYLVVENTEVALSCDVQPWSLACAPRTALVLFAYHQYLGLLALLLALLATWRRTRFTARLALAVSMAGLTLYSYEPSAAALLVAAMVLVRINQDEAQAAAQTA
ncbi:MAG: hypothetical protein Q4E06_06525 [Lautropia sp.]|nr:hypothetical protein [Lautropia sp.]